MAKKQILTLGAYIVGVIVFSLTVLEIATRALNLAPAIYSQPGIYVADDYLHFRHAPYMDTQYTALSGEFTNRIKHNSLGFRDREHSYDKPENVFRILGLGDSFTYGSGAEFEQTFLFLLEQMLNRDSIGPVEIIKAGQSRYFPETERRLLELEGVKYSPDLILVAFLPNDVMDTYSGIDALRVDQFGYLLTSDAYALGSVLRYLYVHSHVSRVLIKKYLGVKRPALKATQAQEIYRKDGFHEGDWVKIENEYERMITIANGIGAQVVFVYIPSKGPWGEEHTYPAKRLSDFASRHNAGFINILPAMMKNADGEALYYAKDGHCTPKGYKVIAEEIYSYLQDKVRIAP